jgi:hypothetical protein
MKRSNQTLPYNQTIAKKTAHLRSITSGSRAVATSSSYSASFISSSSSSSISSASNLYPVRQDNVGASSTDNRNSPSLSSLVRDSADNPSDVLSEPVSTLFRPFSKLPQCKVAIGIMLKAANSKRFNSSFITSLPSFMNFYKGKYSSLRNPSRIEKELKRFSNLNKSFSDECKRLTATVDLNSLEGAISSDFTRHSRVNFQLYDKQPCEVCFPSDNNDVQTGVFSNIERFKLQMRDFYRFQLSQGRTVEECDKMVHDFNEITYSGFKNDDSRNVTSVSSLRKEVNDLKSENSSMENEIDEIKRILIDNHEAYSANLNNHAAFLHYYLDISRRQIKLMDQQVYCDQDRSKDFAEFIDKFSELKNVFPHTSHDPLFQEYIAFVKSHKKEPKFSELGEAYNLHGARQGSSVSRQTQLAEAICYRMLAKLKNSGSELDQETYAMVSPIALKSYNKRQGYKKFSLIEKSGLNLKFPRTPSLKEAINQVNKMEEDGEILLGEPIPQNHKMFDNKSQEWIEISSVSRKNSLNTLRSHILDKHIKNDLVRAKSKSYYDALSREEALTALYNYGVVLGSEQDNNVSSSTQTNDDSEPSTQSLRDLVHYLETHRPYLIWYDHATVGGLSYILFNFSYIYTPAAYHSEILSERDLQHCIEEPRTYFIGISRSTTAHEESFAQMRLDDIKLCSSPVTKNNIAFHDVYRFTTGDNPVRTVESGNNKTGCYRFATSMFWLPSGQTKNDCVVTEERSSDHEDGDDIAESYLVRRVGTINSIKVDDTLELLYDKVVLTEHLTTKKLRDFANEGGYFTNDNIGKSMLDEDNMMDVYKTRFKAEYLKNKKISIKDAKKFVKDELKGRKHQPLLFMLHPEEDPLSLNLNDWEIAPSDPMHECKSISKALFKYVPGKCKSPINTPGGKPELESEDQRKMRESCDRIVKLVKDCVLMVGDEVYLLKAEHSAEDQFKFLINITRRLEEKFFSGNLEEICGLCKSTIFQLTGEIKCPKCIFMGIYRSFLEIHVFGYQDHSKKTCLKVLRFYNLVYIFFTYLSYFDRSFSRTNLYGICSNVYFINIIRYFPEMYELHNLLSFNAGRHEGQFKIVKKSVDNFSNKQHFTEKFPLHLMTRLEVKRHLDSELKPHVTSSVSKMISEHFKKSPPTDIIFDRTFIENTGNSSSFLAHLQRISTYVKWNPDYGYFTFTSQGIRFLVQSLSDSARYPPYPLYNVLVSSIHKIRVTKEKVFSEFKDKIMRNHSVSDVEIDFDRMEQLFSYGSGFVEEVHGTSTCAPPPDIAELRRLEDENMRAVKYVTLLNMLKEVPFPSWGISYGGSCLKTTMCQCLAKIFGESVLANALIELDRATEKKSRYVGRRLKVSGDSEYEYRIIRKYAEKLKCVLEPLEKEETRLKRQTTSLNRTISADFDVDMEDSVSNTGAEFYSNETVKEISNIRQRLDVVSTIKNKLNFEFNTIVTENCFML